MASLAGMECRRKYNGLHAVALRRGMTAVPMSDNPSTPPREEWPLSAAVITALAVSTTVGLALAVYVLATAGSDIRGPLLAVLPIYFIAAFFASLVVFWTLRAAAVWMSGVFGDGRLGTRGHGAVALLTFAVAGLLHYAQGAGLQRLLDGRAVAGGRAGSCPERMECLPLTSAEELADLDSAARLRAAERGRLSAATFALLMRDPDPRVRSALAHRSDLPVELLERLAGDRAAEVREAVAASPRLSDEAMNRLAVDPSENVRLTLARNRSTPPTALDMLAGSASGIIREEVASHPRASEPVLRRLIGGRSDRAERLARQRLGGGTAEQ